MPILLHDINTKVGRPKLPEEDKKHHLSLTLSKNTLQTIDSIRGQIPRSAYIESVLLTQSRLGVDTHEFVRRNGAVYTPPVLANFIAGKVTKYLFETHLKSSSNQVGPIIKSLRIIDPACGSGELLNAIWNNLRLSGKQKLIEQIDPRDILCGVEIDQRAIASVSFRLDSIAVAAGFSDQKILKITKTNALLPFTALPLLEGWRRIQSAFSAPEGFDVVIANPPWGADVSEYKNSLDQDFFTLFQGQYDSSDLFVELALSILRPDGLLAFIIPDSLFSYEHRSLRKLLLEKSQIRFVGRLGEKFFEDINRACVVIICQKKSPHPKKKVHCLRLPPDARKRILDGTSTFGKEEPHLLHEIPQKRFIDNPHNAFDIDLNVGEERILSCINKSKNSFSDFLESTRGVELSKKGRICQCPKCHLWFPLPILPKPCCQHCGATLTEQIESVSIIKDKFAHDATPLIVGENVDRYRIQQSLWLLKNYSGINYKDPGIYLGPKLLIRKTGVGISAMIDYTNALTNQVVYIFRQKKSELVPEIPLEFFLGIINSRAMYYFLTKRHGEIEWRSHPYLTQSQILALPMPATHTFLDNSRPVRQITKLLSPFTKQSIEPPPSIDAEVEKIVADLFGLTKKDYNSIFKTLDNVQELLPVRKLKRIKITDIFKNEG